MRNWKNALIVLRKIFICACCIALATIIMYLSIILDWGDKMIGISYLLFIITLSSTPIIYENV